MSGSALAMALPPTAGPAREKMILDAVRRRDIVPIEWVPIQTQVTVPPGDVYTATIYVSRDALRIGDMSSSFRATVNHETAQLIADELGAVLPTPKLSDEIWAQASLRLPALSQAHKKWVDDGTMSDTQRMLEQSALVDAMIVKHGGSTGLIADVGKDWVTTKRLWQPYDPPAHCEQGFPRSANYGWHMADKWMFKSASLPNTFVLQPVGLCHGMEHTDYSQVVRLIRRDVEVCGPAFVAAYGGCVSADIEALATSKELAGLVSHVGTLPAMRHPDVGRPCDVSCPSSDPIAAPPGMFGPLSCSASCTELPPPTAPPLDLPPEYQGAGMTGAQKLVTFSLGVAVGYAAMMLLPSP